MNDRITHVSAHGIDSDSDGDDRTIGQIWDRRSVLRLLGFTGTALFVGCGGGGTNVDTSGGTSGGGGGGGGTGACVATPANVEGPYFVDEGLNRSDIRSNVATGALEAGVPLTLMFTVSQIVGTTCSALAGATFDVWHANAAGKYSDEAANNTVGLTFLRGYQTTDAAGLVQFTTIYPGWYNGRTVHLHFKVRTATGRVFTSQLFFDDAVTNAVSAQPPYNAVGARTNFNSNDSLYNAAVQAALSPSGAGYVGSLAIAFA